MTNSFSSLKQNRKSQFDKLTAELTKINQNSSEQGGDDDRYWQPEVDKSGNGYAVIRFLPAPKNEDVPFVRIWDHAFQGPGGWYIEKSLTTFNKPDPVSEHNNKLWNSGVESNKNIARKQKRQLKYYSNILVVSDPNRPQNEGKVFLFRYGKKIFDKINEAMYPQFPGETPLNPFDFWEGANFKLKIRHVDGYRNYDKSEFDKPSAISDDDSDLERIWNTQHSLQELLDPKHFKNYDELKFRLEKALGNIDSAPTPSKRSVVAEDDGEYQAPAPQAKSAPAKEPAKASTPWDEDDDEDLSFFKKLATAD